MTGRYQVIEELGKGGMGRVYEEQGLREKAKEHYQKFLELWKDADLVLPEVEEAKAGLSGLNKNIL